MESIYLWFPGCPPLIGHSIGSHYYCHQDIPQNEPTFVVWALQRHHHFHPLILPRSRVYRATKNTIQLDAHKCQIMGRFVIFVHDSSPEVVRL